MHRRTFLAGMVGTAAAGATPGCATARDASVIGDVEYLNRLDLPTYRKPSLQDPNLQTALKERLTAHFGREVRIQFPEDGSYRLVARQQHLFDPARNLVENALAELTFSVLTAENKWRPDYYRVTQRFVDPLRRYGQSRFGAFAGMPRLIVSSVQLLAQDITYKLPDLGYMMPSEVLLRGYGDCDSKATLVAALVAGLAPSLTLRFIEVPAVDHLLIAVSLPPEPGEMAVQLEGQQMLLLEVAGPGRFPPGIMAPPVKESMNRDGVNVLLPT